VLPLFMGIIRHMVRGKSATSPRVVAKNKEESGR
jgi:hypothetical protein